MLIKEMLMERAAMAVRRWQASGGCAITSFTTLEFSLVSVIPALGTRVNGSMNAKSEDKIRSNEPGRTAARASRMTLVGARELIPSAQELAELVTSVARSRDKQAFAALFRHYAPRLKSFLLKQGFTEGECDDLVQEAMVNLWRKAESFDPAKAGVSTWVFTIARNLGIDRRRRNGRVSATVELGDYDEVDPDPTAEQQMILRQNEVLVREALTKLPAEQAMVIRMSFFGENPQAEIASLLGIPLGTVKSRVRLALNRLRQIMEEKK
jgi:RNA polymerase sigma-70 factor, ECF subfamily